MDNDTRQRLHRTRYGPDCLARCEAGGRREVARDRSDPRLGGGMSEPRAAIA
jgi:hypothetical protein